MGPEEFVRQLRDLGFEVQVVQGLAVFPYAVPVGSRAGEQVQLGLAIPPDFPASPPPGPHVSPRLGHPQGAVSDSLLGVDWEYWSRPFPDWPRTERSVRAYMVHVRTLFSQL